MAAGGEWIFISYRREDTLAEAQALSKWIGERFSSGSVFLDERSIDYGDKFDEVIGARLRNALVVLVLIGPQWLKTLQDRAAVTASAGGGAHAPEQDYVRLEVAQALQQAAAGRTRIIPLIKLPAKMPGGDALKAAELFDLSALSKTNGAAFERVPTEFDGLDITVFDALALRIEACMSGMPDAGDLSRRGSVTKALDFATKDICNAKDFTGFSRHWQQEGVASELHTSTVEGLFRLAAALMKWNSERALNQARFQVELVSVRQRCHQLLGHMLMCAFDRVQARVLAENSACIPIDSPGLAAAAVNAGQGRVPVVHDAGHLKGAGDFKLKRQVDLGANDLCPGDLDARTEQLATELHNRFIAENNQTQQLDEHQRDILPIRIKRMHQHPEGPVHLSLVRRGDAGLDALHELSRRLGVYPLAYAGENSAQHSLALEDPVELRAAMMECLDRIQEIQ